MYPMTKICDLTNYVTLEKPLSLTRNMRIPTNTSQDNGKDEIVDAKVFSKVPGIN